MKVCGYCLPFKDVVRCTSIWSLYFRKQGLELSFNLYLFNVQYGDIFVVLYCIDFIKIKVYNFCYTSGLYKAASECMESRIMKGVKISWCFHMYEKVKQGNFGPNSWEILSSDLVCDFSF